MEPLRVAILPIGSSFTLNVSAGGEVAVTGGIEVELLDAVLRGLGRPHTLMIPEDGVWGAPAADGNWSGLVGLVQRGEADLALSSIFVSEARMSAVAFTQPYNFREITFATRRPGLRHKAMAFAWPFTWLVWLSLGVSLVGLTAAFRFVLRAPPSVGVTTLHVVGVLLRQPNGIRSSSLRDRHLLMTWMMGSFFLSYGYTAVLLSFLSVPVVDPPLETVSQLADAVVQGRYQCATTAGSSIIESLLKSKDEYVRTIGLYIWKEDWFMNLMVKKDVEKYLDSGNRAVIATRESITDIFQEQLHVSKESLFSSPTAIIINHKSTLKSRLDTIVKRVNGAGIYQKNMRDHFYRKRLTSEHYEPPNPHIQLSLSDMYGAFVLLGSGLVAASLACMAEKMHSKILARNRAK